MGSSRLVTSTTHLHVEFNFTESYIETVKPLLNYSCRSTINRQGISLPQNRQDTTAVNRMLNQCEIHIILDFRHWANFRPYTSFFNFAKSCVFGKQLQLSIFCNLFFSLENVFTEKKKTSLLPKIREYFAEFLNVSYLIHLSILIPILLYWNGRLYVSIF